MYVMSYGISLIDRTRVTVNRSHNILLKKVKDHYCVAVVGTSSPTDFVYIEEQCLLIRPISFLQ